MPNETITKAERSIVGNDSATIALRALVWILSDSQRASRFLALTGLEPDDLRQRIADPALHAAALAFLAAHEADLVACAEEIGVSPADLQAAARDLAA